MAEGLGVAASAIAVIDLSAKVASLCLQYSKDVKHAKDDIIRIHEEVIRLKNTSTDVQNLVNSPRGAKLKTSQKLGDTLKDSQSQLERLEHELTPSKGRQAMKQFGFRALKWLFKSGSDKTVLDKLPVAEGAAFDSHAEEHNPTCLQDTRVELLHDISRWAKHPQAAAIFWLNGMAGTGKSTISRTVAHSFSKGGQLGASFFFKRGEGDRGGISKFFTTIAAQLVERVPALALHVQNALNNNKNIIGKALREQFETLVLMPLSKISQDTWKTDTLVIVIDALDECERDEDVKLIINLLSRANALRSPRIRIFITSRPELPIRLGFNAVKGTYQDLVLHKIPEPVIEHDLFAYFKHELTKIRNDYNCSVSKDRQLPSHWPEQSDIQILVKMAIPLFIFAATACRFLADRKSGNPNRKLLEILKHRTKSQHSKLDATYLPVLDQMLVGLSNREISKALQEFRDVIGSIVVLASPLSTSALARMLNMAQDTVEDRVDLLHSVLDAPLSSNSPVRLLHLSFRDFLLDPEKSDKNLFWVNEKETHKQLAAQCLRVMDEALRTDICGVRRPGTPQSSIDPQIISDNLRPEVHSPVWISLNPKAGMYWGKCLQTFEGHSKSVRSVAFSHDSKLVASASDDKTVRIWSAVTGELQQTLEGHTDSVNSVAFSHDSKLVASASGDKTVQIWSADTGELQQTLEGHNDSVNSVAFSHDSKLVASASDDKTVRIWSAVTGDCLRIVDLGTVSWSLSFDKERQTLLTDTGLSQRLL
ncbi:hypothetical protein DL767_009786 [Monosporascus sp. MG133]|nr:hypothetical protein DL767_009786 [Monosporascus sp. MG133]